MARLVTYSSLALTGIVIQISRLTVFASSTTASQRAPSASVRFFSSVGRSAQLTMLLAFSLVESQSINRNTLKRETWLRYAGVNVGGLVVEKPGRITRRFFTGLPGGTDWKRSAIVSAFNSGKFTSNVVVLLPAVYTTLETVPEAAEDTAAWPLKIPLYVPGIPVTSVCAAISVTPKSPVGHPSAPTAITALNGSVAVPKSLDWRITSTYS